jgi:hypothetical protein
MMNQGGHDGHRSQIAIPIPETNKIMGMHRNQWEYSRNGGEYDDDLSKATKNQLLVLTNFYQR